MHANPTLLPVFITTINNTISANADEVAELDRAIGDGDHLINLQRGLDAVNGMSAELAPLDWSAAFMKRTCSGPRGRRRYHDTGQQKGGR